MVKILGGAALAAILSAPLTAQSAVPTRSQACAALLDELTGPPAASMTAGQPSVRLQAWAEHRVKSAILTLRAFAAAMSSQDVLLASRQVRDVAASVRLLAHDEQLIDQAQARHCSWAPEAAQSLKAH